MRWSLTSDRVIGGSQSGQCVDIPQEDGTVKSGRRDVFPVLRIGQRLHIVLDTGKVSHGRSRLFFSAGISLRFDVNKNKQEMDMVEQFR